MVGPGCKILLYSQTLAIIPRHRWLTLQLDGVVHILGLLTKLYYRSGNTKLTPRSSISPIPLDPPTESTHDSLSFKAMFNRFDVSVAWVSSNRPSGVWHPEREIR
jgi:hypothetical protein